jgi:hypothetical protein
MGKTVAVGALCALSVGCGYGAADVTIGDSIELFIGHDDSGDVSFVELALGTGLSCGTTKVDLALKDGAPKALHMRHRPPCRS